MITLDDIRAAEARIRDRVHRTPLLGSETLATRVGASRVWLKCENLQKTGSFKVRGVLNKLSHLDAAECARGVIGVSAGNHAQALAWGARAAGVHCTVVMPETAPQSKVDASRGYGATVVQVPNSALAFTRARELTESEGFTFVHPFDDDAIIAGGGTATLEILEQADRVDVLVIPVGGGGLISGAAIAMRALSPHTRIIGVEPTGACGMRQSLDAGKALHIDAPSSIADGLAAPMAGEHTFEIVSRYVDDVILVNDEEIGQAMLFLLSRCKLLAEGAGAAATAALLTGRITVKHSDSVVAIVSGGNVDLSRISQLDGASS
ncbi:MAG: threonine/serine dehydratase [Gemmatimonadota bacterium]|nr:threonine/serine dehydratase [Gemmatimonadota bacterium]